MKKGEKTYLRRVHSENVQVQTGSCRTSNCVLERRGIENVRLCGWPVS